MSTSAHRATSAGQQDRTVAELVAREHTVTGRDEPDGREPRRTTGRSGSGQQPGGRSKGTAGKRGTHVTELLHRESGGATTAPDAFAEPRRKERSRTATTSRAAVVFGVAVGGMIALQSTAATPQEHTAGRAGSNDAAVAGPTSGHGTDTSVSGSSTAGSSATSTDTTVDLRGNESELDQPGAEQQHPAGGAGAQSTTAAQHVPPGSGTDTESATGRSQQETGPHAGEQPPPDEQTPTATEEQQPSSVDGAADGSAQDESGPRDNSRAGQQNTAQHDQNSGDNKGSQEDGDSQDSGSQDGGSQDGDSQDGDTNGDEDDGSHSVLDPVTGTVSGVLDAGTSLLGD